MQRLCAYCSPKATFTFKPSGIFGFKTDESRFAEVKATTSLLPLKASLPDAHLFIKILEVSTDREIQYNKLKVL